MKTKEKTDKNKVERLFLYCLGMSPVPMSIAEIEDAVGVKNRPHRQNYVYEVKKRLYHASPYLPSNLVFTEDDFLTKQSGEFILEPLRFRNKIFKEYKDYFKCESKDDLLFDTPEKEDENQNKIKCIKISDHRNNYLRIEINFTNLSETKKLEKDQIRIFQKSRFTDLEIEPYFYVRREKGTRLTIRNFNFIPNFSFLDYIDIVSTEDEEKYVLNLRGLLYLFLIYDGKLDVTSVEKIVSSVSSIDEYRNLEDEIDSAYGSIYSIKNIDYERTSVKKIFGSNSSYQIKKRFPFLSFYDCYKDYIHTHNETFISDFIFDVAQDFEQQLRNMSITKLKYEVTKRYLERIRRYFYSFHTQRLVHVNLSDDTFKAITKLQDEIAIYIEEMKRSDYEQEKTERHGYEKECAKIDFQRKFNALTNSDEKVISLKTILSDNGNPRVFPNNTQKAIIDRFCEYSREENESYSVINHCNLIKNSLLKEIAIKVNKNSPYDTLQSELDRNGITLDCLKDIKRWINNYFESLEQ
ncbi:MAG: hypothetical protein L0H53_02170 [Candidatus Nitrosocosmicus sp.]|nr:hypothetical protein [Candidatus Nitrosocosmicus sp.]MDN5866987.1 hypothetical protein [Candidatus Nitrosocosmicus sp.]